MTDPVKAKIIELLDTKPRERKVYAHELENYGGDMFAYHGVDVFIKWLAKEHFAVDVVEMHADLGEGKYFIIKEYRPITLADVLRAIEKGSSHGVSIDTVGDFYDIDEREIGWRWMLEYDYDNQTQEVKEFIGRLLGVN